MEMIRVAMASRSKFAVFPMQDVLGLGSEARLNTPGRRSGNWLWRVKEEQMSNASIGELAEMSVRYGRKVPLGQSGIK